MTGLRRGRDDLGVVAVVKHLALAGKVFVEAARDPHRPALDTARERGAVGGLADHVDVVALDRELTDPELIGAAAVHERALQDLAELEPAQAGDLTANAHGDVHGIARLGDRARAELIKYFLKRQSC